MILTGLVVVLAGAVGLAAAADLYLLARMAAAARVEFGAVEIEVVVTGSGLPPGRLGPRAVVSGAQRDAG